MNDAACESSMLPCDFKMSVTALNTSLAMVLASLCGVRNILWIIFVSINSVSKSLIFSELEYPKSCVKIVHSYITVCIKYIHRQSMK